MGAGFSGAAGLAEEGTLKEKAPNVALMAGVGFIGGGILGGFLPPVLRSIPKALKSIWDKVVPKGVKNVVLPVLREVERQAGKVKTTTAVKLEGGVVSTETKINEVTTKLNNRREALDNIVLGDVQFIAPKAGSRNAAESIAGITKTRLSKRTEEINRLNKEIVKLEKQHNKLLSESAHNSLQAGDVIFSKDVGRVKIVSFITDEVGRVAVIGEDINGRVVTVLWDDLAKMKKILKPEVSLVKEFVGLPELPIAPVQRGKVQVFLDGLKRYIQTTSKFLSDMGESGKQLSGLFGAAIDETSRKIGTAKILMQRTITRLGLDKATTALTKEESKNIVDILDNGLRIGATTFEEIPVKPINERVSEFVRVFFGTTQRLVNEANELGIKVRDKSTGKQYAIGEANIHFPHIPKDMEKLKQHLPEIIELQMKRQNITRQQATRILNDFVKDLGTVRFAGLEKRRTLLLEGFDELEKYGYETNPIVALDDFGYAKNGVRILINVMNKPL